MTEALVTPQNRAFSLDQFERYDLHSQLVDKACQIALREGLVDKALMKKFGVLPAVTDHSAMASLQEEQKSYDQDKLAHGAQADAKSAEPLDNLLYLAQQFRAAAEDKKPELFARLGEKAKLTPKEQEQLANLMDLLVPVLNAANSVKEREYSNHSADEIFKNYLLSGLKIVMDGKNKFGQRPAAWLEHIKEAKSDLILSFVNTSHPTNFHTPFGRSYEKGLITFLNALSFEKEGILKQDDLEGAFATQISNACKSLKEGKTITYIRKVTVGEEMETEKEVLHEQKRIMPEVLQAWNIALSDKAVMREAVKAGTGICGLLQALRLTPEERIKAYEQRSWILGGADKDGRDESTDSVFYAAYKDTLDEEGLYPGPILDLRDNAEIRKKLMNALIARSYGRDAEFRIVCDQFCKTAPEPVGDFKHTDEQFHKLSEINQAAFLELLMTKGINLFSRRMMRTEAVGFNEAYYKVLHGDSITDDQGFLKKQGLDRHTAYWGMSDDQRGALLKAMSKVEGYVETNKDDEPPKIKKGPYNINRVHDDNLEVTGFNYHHTSVDRPLTDGEPSLRDGQSLNKEESLSCMSYLRRLFMVNHVLEEQAARGNTKPVVEREQAANFENVSDFFAHLYLFQQAGLVTIENGKVTKVKVGIQPLFETTPEMRRGPEIIDKILASPLGESYYKARGKAEFMVGYSDGAKSGGNFASHVRIREFERAITRKFKDKFGEDFEVRILRGPGRGENRGGVRKYDRQYVLHDDTVNTSAVSDQTLQGDLIIRMQMDPKFAERTFAEIMVSTLAGAVKGKHMAQVAQKLQEGDAQSSLEIRRIESFENAIHFIADHSESQFREGVFEKEKECDDFIKTINRNPDASSRRQKRANTKQKGLGPQRAITVEYAANIAGVPLCDYGLKTSLEEFIANGPAVLDKDGREVRGEEALMVLARDCDFFREEMKLCSIRQQSFNPAIADIWAEKANQQGFIGDIVDNLKGLADICQQLLSGNKAARAHTREDFSGEPFLPALADIAQAVLTVNHELQGDLEKKPVEKARAHRVYFALQAPVSERPAGLMRSQSPGFSLAS